LHYAVLNKNDDVIKLLLIAGADMDIKGQSGSSPVEIAEKLKLNSLSLFLLAKGFCKFEFQIVNF
jgi:ankyrin repeat protein